jgi:trehalose synthase
MSATLDEYAAVVGPQVIDHLHRLARPLRGKRIVHVNATTEGGGVAEILHRLVPLMRELGLDTAWEVIHGDGAFFFVTKSFHNALQGTPAEIPPHLLQHYEAVNHDTAGRLAAALIDADFVFIHDPQPAALLRHLPRRRGKWIWRCHIDVSRPHRPVWKYLREFLRPFDASIFSLPAFAQPLPHPQFLIAPSIDPLSEKNCELSAAEVASVSESVGVLPDSHVVLQVSRFDRFKDPVGVIRAYRMARTHAPQQLVLAGGGASDDPEGETVLREVQAAAGDDADIKILQLPPDAHRTINALQRRADVVMQKSIREGFGLTVTEALWKGKPVIGGNTGGITLQVVDGWTGFLVNTPEGAAFRLRYLRGRPGLGARMGERGRRHVHQNFLLTRNLREYLILMLTLNRETSEPLWVDSIPEL